MSSALIETVALPRRARTARWPRLSPPGLFGDDQAHRVAVDDELDFGVRQQPEPLSEVDVTPYFRE